MKIDYYKDVDMDYPYLYCCPHDTSFRIKFNKNEARLCLKLSKVLEMKHLTGVHAADKSLSYDNLRKIFK